MKLNYNWKIWLLITFIVLSLIMIFGIPLTFFQKGVLVTSVNPNSLEFQDGIRSGQIITSVNGQSIETLEDYSKIIQETFISGENVKLTLTTKEAEVILFSNSAPNLTVSEIPKTNIKVGLDLAGGSRALVKAKEKSLLDSEANELADVIANRLNVYGLEDIKVDRITDLSGENFVRIEIAGTTPEDVKSLISEQGKFEAKIGNETVFVGGEKDITSVVRSGQNALVESCNQDSSGTYYCNFRFSIFLSQNAAEKHAQATTNLDVNVTAEGNFLSQRLDLYLDDTLVDSLLISEGLKGRATTQISISGSGTGETEEQAYENARKEMNRLQTVLITGSLPYELELVKLDTISPSLGNEFIKSIVLAGIAALIAVSLIVFIRYRNIKSSLALLLTSFSEVLIILGIASFIKWNLDLPSIAGILATIGTGIDQQLIILDETHDKAISIKQRLKRAFAIIFGAYLTAVVAMIPLYWAAAGFFKGFAITTIIGITAGILVTRPAFAEIIKNFEN